MRRTPISCQVILKKDLVNAVPKANSEVWQGLINEHKRKHPEDTIPIPKSDPEPQVCYRCSNSGPGMELTELGCLALL